MTENTTQEDAAKSSHPLAQKITSKDQLDSILNALCESPEPFTYSDSQQELGIANHVRPPEGADRSEWSREYETHGWWLRREQYREANGIYEKPTAVLLHMRQFFGVSCYFPHVSTKVLGEIAYTASRRDGEADRQVRTTIGKFLSKFCPLLTDKTIAYLDAQHKSEMDDTFLIADTRESVQHVYTTMVGDTGCMRYPADQWGFGGMHPSIVYAAPQYGLSVAYLTNADGAVNARSVIYQNPDDPKDKRYVRIYGSPILRSKLERAGFVCAGLGGVKIPRIEVPPNGSKGIEHPNSERRYVILPYLDPAGGRGSGIDNCNISGGVWFEGDDFLYMLTSEQYDRIHETAPSAFTFGTQSTSACIEVRTTKAPRMTCALTEKAHNSIFVEFVNIADDVNNVRPATRSAAVAAGYTMKLQAYGEAPVRSQGSGFHVYIKPDSADAMSDGGYFKSDGTYEARGYYRLDPLIYKKGPTHTTARVFKVREEDGVNYYAKTVDAEVETYEQNGATRARFIHHSQVTDDFVQVLPPATLSGTGVSSPSVTAMYVARKDHPRLCKTMGGKWAVRGFSEIGLHVNGKLCSKSLGRSFVLARTTVRVPTGGSITELSDEAAKIIFNDAFDYYTVMGYSNAGSLAHVVSEMVNCGGNRPPTMTSNNTSLRPWSGWENYGPEQLIRVVKTMRGMRAAGVPFSGNSTLNSAWTGWLKVAEVLCDKLVDADQSWKRRYDEHPGYVPPAPPEPVEAATPPSEVNADDALLDQLLNEPIGHPDAEQAAAEAMVPGSTTIVTTSDARFAFAA